MHMKQSFSWSVKCDTCSWEMGGWSVKGFTEDEAKRHKINGCIKEKETDGRRTERKQREHDRATS
jgi:hypothetical protein